MLSDPVYDLSGDFRDFSGFSRTKWGSVLTVFARRLPDYHVLLLFCAAYLCYSQSLSLSLCESNLFYGMGLASEWFLFLSCVKLRHLNNFYYWYLLPKEVIYNFCFTIFTHCCKQLFCSYRTFMCILLKQTYFPNISATININKWCNTFTNTSNCHFLTSYDHLGCITLL